MIAALIVWFPLVIRILAHPSAKPDEYLDPGSGSFIIQLLVAGLLGLGFVIRASWGKIKTFFGRGGEETTAETVDIPETDLE